MPTPIAGTGPLISWFLTSQTFPPGAGKAAIPSWRPGSTVAPLSIKTGKLRVVEGAVLEAARKPEPDYSVAQVGHGA